MKIAGVKRNVNNKLSTYRYCDLSCCGLKANPHTNDGIFNFYVFLFKHFFHFLSWCRCRWSADSGDSTKDARPFIT